jgi:hypothetical protein
VVNPIGFHVKTVDESHLCLISLCLPGQMPVSMIFQFAEGVINIDKDYVSLRACLSSMSIISEIVMISGNMNFVPNTMTR